MRIIEGIVMNIFVFSNSQTECVKYLDDKRVIKMILETAQILNTNLRVSGVNEDWLYKETHKNHPCVIWARKSKQNFNWLVIYGKKLCEEYTLRYGKTHKCEENINKCWKYCELFPDIGKTEFENCSLFKELSVFDAYKETMKVKWDNDTRTPSWKIRGIPKFYEKLAC